MKFKYVFEAPGDFEKGCCANCPLSIIDWDNDQDLSCALHCCYEECPLEKVNESRKEEKKMKVLKGLEEIKYMALYTVYMYNHTGNPTYRFTLNHIIAKVLDDYGIAGLTEVLDFIQSETE